MRDLPTKKNEEPQAEGELWLIQISEVFMTDAPIAKNLLKSAAGFSGPYENVVVAEINDHVVRLSMMTEPYFWHLHPDSDELFVGLEGTLVLEVEDQRFELHAGDALKVPRGVKHRTAPLGPRSLNLTVERAQMTTIRSDRPISEAS